MNFNLPNRRSFLQRSLVFFAGLTATPLLGRNKATPSVLFSSNAPTVGIEPFLGEIMLVSYNFAPRGWALCAGQLLPIAQNQALFALLGTTFGGNGQTTFALPDLRGRMAVGASSTSAAIQLGELSGAESTTLLAANIPSLSMTLDKAQIRTAGTQGAGLSDGGTQAGSPNALRTNGSATPITNMPPYTVLNYVIALQGIFPSRP
jgi:microcystin-dependent protein